MRKLFFLFCALVGLLIFNSCVSTPSILDHGFYPAGKTPEEVATIIVDKNLNVTAIDESSPFVTFGIAGWKEKTKDSQLQKFTINKGVHSISVNFHSGSRFSIFPKVFFSCFFY